MKKKHKVGKLGIRIVKTFEGNKYAVVDLGQPYKKKDFVEEYDEKTKLPVKASPFVWMETIVEAKHLEDYRGLGLEVVHKPVMFEVSKDGLAKAKDFIKNPKQAIIV